MEAIRRESVALVRHLERATGWHDPQTVEDRRQTAIVKLLDGTITWDPSRVDLKRRLVSAIASEISHELERSLRRRHISLDDEVSDIEHLERAIGDADDTTARAPESLWERAIAALREQASDDKAVTAMLDAFAGGATDKREVLAATGMSARTYNAARERLVRMARRMHDIREQLRVID